MKPSRIAFEQHWLKTRGKRARNDLQRHPAQPQTYISDAANRHWVTWQAAQPKEPEQQPVQTTAHIAFYNGNKPSEENEVMRITKEGIKVNPSFKPDEAASAVLRALDSQIKNLMTQPEQPAQQERNFCQRCGKRLGKNDWDLHTCTPPQRKADHSVKEENNGHS